MSVIPNIIAIYLIQFGFATFVRLMDRSILTKSKYILCIIPAFGVFVGIFLILKMAFTD